MTSAQILGVGSIPSASLFRRLGFLDDGRELPLLRLPIVLRLHTLGWPTRAAAQPLHHLERVRLIASHLENRVLLPRSATGWL